MLAFVGLKVKVGLAVKVKVGVSVGKSSMTVSPVGVDVSVK